MKVTITEIDPRPEALESGWSALVEHSASCHPDLILLPEMPFGPWLARTNQVDAEAWSISCRLHDLWIERLPESGSAVVAGTRPLVEGGKRYNEGFIWDDVDGYLPVHRKTYLPSEPGFWEAARYERGPTEFLPVETRAGRIGFLICTEMWFFAEARTYGKAEVDIIVTPRATESATAERWRTGGRVTAIMSGAFHLSSALTETQVNPRIGGGGWAIAPSGEILSITKDTESFATISIELADARIAKTGYPLFIDDSPVQ